MIRLVELDLGGSLLASDASASLANVRIEVKDFVTGVAKEEKRLIGSTADDPHRGFELKTPLQALDVNRIDFAQSKPKGENDERRLKTRLDLGVKDFFGSELTI